VIEHKAEQQRLASSTVIGTRTPAVRWKRSRIVTILHCLYPGHANSQAAPYISGGDRRSEHGELEEHAGGGGGEGGAGRAASGCGARGGAGGGGGRWGAGGGRRRGGGGAGADADGELHAAAAVAADAADVVVAAGGEGDGGRAVLDGVHGVAGVAGVVVALGDLQHIVAPGGEVERCRRGGREKK